MFGTEQLEPVTKIFAEWMRQTREQPWKFGSFFDDFLLPSAHKAERLALTFLHFEAELFPLQVPVICYQCGSYVLDFTENPGPSSVWFCYECSTGPVDFDGAGLRVREEVLEL